jgi:hypothetical protein
MKVPKQTEPRELERMPARALLRQLAWETERLVHDDVSLVREELRQDFRSAATGGTAFGLGAALALTGFWVLCFTAVYLLALLIPLWVAGLVVGAGLLGAGGLLVWGGTREARKLAHRTERTAQRVREEAGWMAEKLH